MVTGDNDSITGPATTEFESQLRALNIKHVYTVKMAEACPGTTFHKLDSLRAWHVREATYSKTLAEMVNNQHRLPFSGHWGAGATSSSDGQYFHVGGRGEHAGQVNARYGSGPGVTFYTHISDRYAPFHTKVINATVRDATHVLDGLLYMSRTCESKVSVLLTPSGDSPALLVNWG